MTAPEATRYVDPAAGSAEGTVSAVTACLLAAGAATGLGLVFLYRPAAATAYRDLVDLEQASGFGFVRALHFWGAHAVLILAALHVLLLGLRGAGARARDWRRALALLVLVTALAATGYLLRGDAETASWLATLWPAAAGGPRLLLVYGLHCTVLPLLAVWLLRARPWRVRRRDPPAARAAAGGGSAGNGSAGSGPAGGGPAGSEPASSVTVGALATGVWLAVVLCALLLETPLGPPPGSALSAPATAPWFLAGLQGLGRYLDPWAAVVAVPLLQLGALAALPGLAAAFARAGRDPAVVRRQVRGVFVLLLLLGLLPTAAALLLPAPPAPGGATAFSELLWGLWLGVAAPARWWLRELPGLLLVTLYFAALPRWLPRWRATRGLFAAYRQDLGRWRYYAAAVWVLALGIVPLKMIGRRLWGIGAWVDLPELGLRF